MGGSWTVEHRCTQCGAPITLEEADRFFTCPFCRVKICLTTKEHFRYYLQPPQESAEKMFYVPYWRIRGIVFSCDEELEVKSSIVDATYCGVGVKSYPESLGLRPQALRLRFATPESGILFPEPSLMFNQVFEKIEAGLPRYQSGNAPIRIFHRSFIGEKVSIVYAPFFIKNRTLHDGILGTPLKPLKDEMNNMPPPGNIGHPLKALPALCPECGWDLDGERDSVIFFCRNCNSAWYLTENDLRRKDFLVLRGGEEHATHLPFWRIRADIAGLDLHSKADLVRLGNLPVVIRSEWESTALYFWVPGFRVHAPLFLRLGRLLTLQQPGDIMECEEVLIAPQSASLPLSDVSDSLKMVVASLIATKKRTWPSLGTISTKAVQTDLVYIPFQEQKDDLFNLSLKISIAKNALKYGQYL
ncbi:MAG: hypothetical protein AB7Y74_00250 [Syntrophorhabdus sp.]|jgi:predicted RNA-binding Zn-ribbon protein involved in translation (DUF1610 family)